MSGKMPGKVQAQKNSSEKKKGLTVNRGTQNELEIVGQIVVANIGLRTLVFDRLKQASARQKTRDSVRKSRGGTDDQAS